ncbi:MAG: deoxyguanosinetriphosphate triphosphohydrolase [Dehalococcoidia bacterium]|nr:deoxyguanosinetriphosphate triphosphohydrolase [Dehalococcoidia bacterium]MDW8119133.1 deoxyguanosinetriphosphate triphosphohydrolase [Chloroflexota bacterium]
MTLRPPLRYNSLVDIQERVRRHLIAREEGLSPYACRSAAALRDRPEPPPPWGTEFQRDRERIVQTNAFRRLKHKTQVFLAPIGDHYMTRLTHTLEVSQMGRAIARALRLNEDLVEAIALAHDLGHTPFGHVGEEVLNSLLPGGFRHAEQSLRIVEHLERQGQGLNLTRPVREGIAHHSKPRGDFLTEIAPGLTLEAQIVRLADALAYLHHDLRDALRAGVLRLEDIPPEPLAQVGLDPTQRTERLIGAVVEASWSATGEIPLPPGVSPRITLPPQMHRAVVALREFMFERVYLPLGRTPESQRARDIVALLFHHYARHPELLPQDGAPRDPPERRAADYVAGMTDQFAIMMAERLRPGIGEGIRWMRL